MPSAPRPPSAKMPYFIEFAKFLGIFIVMIGAALFLIGIIATASGTGSAPASAVSSAAR